MEFRPKRKIRFLIMAICIAFTVISAEAFINANNDLICHDHDYIEVECLICLKIEVSRSSLKYTTYCSVFLGCSPFSSLVPKNNTDFYAYLLSPITQKVRLNT